MYFKDKTKDIVVIVTRTEWDEVPRFRHQVTRQLIRFYNVIYIVKRIDNTNEQVEMLNALGQKVWFQSVRNSSHTQLNVSNYEPGLYLLRFASEEGLFSRKIIIE